MCLSVAQLDGADTAEVEEVARDLVVRGVLGELGVGDEEVGLCDVGRGEVVAEEDDDDRGLSVDILAQDSRAKCGKKDWAQGDDWRAWRWWKWCELLGEKREVEVDASG